MARTIAIGVQDFGKMIQNQYFYVDKTAFIKEWWKNGDEVTLITRPRRFGKTLTMSMLEYFFSVDFADRRDLFQGLAIWKEEKFCRMQGTYPVIFLSFADVKGKNYHTVREGMIQELVDIYHRNAFLLDSGKLSKQEKETFLRVHEEMSDMTAVRSLKRLSYFLYKHFGKKVILLLDEYDTPMQEAWINGYWDAFAEFTRAFLNASLKTNPYLERGLMTGITRVGKESIFSDLNNLQVVTITSDTYQTSFGFTEEEVLKALDEFGMQHQKQGVKRWYDGFRFGNIDNMYNPWSITKFLKEGEFRPYWANTSSNSLAGKLIRKGSKEIKIAMEHMLQGGSFCTYVDEEIVFNQLDHSENAVWSLLLASGYLKVTDRVPRKNGKQDYCLALTNFEIQSIFEDLFLSWFTFEDLYLNAFSKALLANDKHSMNAYLNEIMQKSLSYYDTGKASSKSKVCENFYHGFVLGLIADLREQYVITSNRESGFGRYDILLKSKQDNGTSFIMEFKVLDSAKEKNMQETVQAALQQIQNKKYDTVLKAEGIRAEQIRMYGFAFSGKNVLIDGGCMLDYVTHGC